MNAVTDAVSATGLDTSLKVNGQRLWDSLMTMARIGATPKGGVCRLALTDLDRQGRDLIVSWAKEAGCTVTVDQMGNVFMRRAGRKPDALPVVTGSHADSQPTGGRFDGIYGVLGGLEVIRTLNDHGDRNGASGRSGHLDQRGGLALRAGDGGIGRVRRRLHAGIRPLAQGRGRQDDRRGTEAHRLCGRCAMRRPCTACRVRTAHRAGADSRSGEQDDRRRHRCARAALVRDHPDRTGSARGSDADAAPQGRAARCVAGSRSGQPHRPRSCAACVRDGRHDAGASELAQRDPGARVLYRRLPSS